MTHLFCFGLGYCAQHIATRLTARGWRVSGTSTCAERIAELKRAGFCAALFEGTQSGSGVDELLSQSTHVLLSIPPGSDGDPAYVHHGKTIAHSNRIVWIGYLSTVGVYGDAAGGWVSEEDEANPASDRGKRRLAAERAWQALGVASGKRVDVFRLPGIYGPGRSAIEEVKAGTARRLVKPGQVFNRIHVEDIAGAVVAAIDKGAPGRVYNVTDDEPGPPQDVVAYAAALLGRAPPPEIDFATADLSPMARSFYSESKRVSNARLKQELLPRLVYPTYREGLDAIAAGAKK
ncbi:MAG TPA: SDR family oxidoreductase [Hyphomicrobium sp.]|nr:SDR family oxidoreductase [Hyphomicrobium sp.]